MKEIGVLKFDVKTTVIPNESEKCMTFTINRQHAIHEFYSRCIS